METDNRVRKACDLCYTRRIKCDGQRPRCSNCINYETDCTHKAVSRKSKPKWQRNNGSDKERKMQCLQAHINRLESQLAVVKDEFTGTYDNPTGSMGLPPLHQTMSMIGIFFNTFNSVLPLFHPDTLLRLVGECYALQPRQRDPVAWAAINVALALASQQMPGGSSNGSSLNRADDAADYISKAQSVVSTVILGETRLLNIQTLVGMAMVLQTAHDLHPCLMLASAAMRLVHKLGLHNRSALAHLDPVQRRQHSRVFWLAYILDKDLSLRTQQPSIQLDTDIDLELPEYVVTDDNESEDTAGLLTSTDGSATMNYFLARVQLANIEGGVYDCLYSTRALNKTLEERCMARESIVSALDHWRSSIPPEFRAPAVIAGTRNNPANAGFFCVLYSDSLACLTLINQAHAWDKQWVGSLRNQGREIRALQLPPGWEALVNQARDFMILFGKVWSKDVWFRWMVSCPYLSAMVLLTVNSLYYVTNERVYLDGELIDKALSWLNDALKEMQSDEAQALRDICVEAIETVKWKRAENTARTLGGGLLVDFLDNLELP